MGVVRGLWAAVQGNPEAMVRLHKWLTILWAAVTVPMILFKWYESIAFISVLSLYAIVTGHWSSWQAARVEVKQDVAAEVAVQTEVHREELEQSSQALLSALPDVPSTPLKTRPKVRVARSGPKPPKA